MPDRPQRPRPAHPARTRRNLLAVLREAPVPGHPDPTARDLRVNPVPVPDRIWRHPDGPVAALRHAHDDMRRAGVAQQLTQVTDIRFLAWVYVYTETVDDEDRHATVRQIAAVDIDERATCSPTCSEKRATR